MKDNRISSTPSNKDKNTSRSVMRFICHQKPKRCFKFNGRPMPLCARCFGFYLGLIIGLCLPFAFIDIFEIRIHTLVIILFLGVTPMALDGLTQLLKLRYSNNNLRFTTGILAGLVLGVLFTWLLVHILILDYLKVHWI